MAVLVVLVTGVGGSGAGEDSSSPPRRAVVLRWMSEGGRTCRDGCRPNLEGVKEEEDVTVVERRTVVKTIRRKGREGVDFMVCCCLLVLVVVDGGEGAAEAEFADTRCVIVEWERYA